MSIALHALCAAKGIAIGKVYSVDRGQIEVNEYLLQPDQVEAEVERLQQAAQTAHRQLREIRDHIPRDTSADIASFIDTHLLMLQDSALTKVPGELVRARRCNAEWALKLQRDALVSVFEEMDDSYLRTRKDDVDHVVARIQRILLKQEKPPHEQPGSLLSGHVVLAHDLTPADTVLLQHQGIVGFITEYGGPTSHTAILARSLRIPSIVGLHQARSYVQDEDLVIIDGRAGVLLVDPDERVVNYYRRLQREIERYHTLRQRLRGVPARTRDGCDVTLQANIELPSDVEAVREVSADGVGLYRTEFLFMNRDTMPDEEEQFEAYASVVKSLKGSPVTIRTLDIGADKPSSDARQGGSYCANPALGLRGVRLCLKEPSLFYPQLRAIMRASVFGPVRLMLPMLSTLQEVTQVRRVLEDCRRSLKRDGLKTGAELPVGAMIEVPAAVLCADLLATHIDFFSIGTNDLIQYAIAIDRVDDEVNYLYDPLHPAVLRLIRMTIEAGQQAGIPVGMCGEMAGNSTYTRLLLGMGLNEFSVPPNALLEIKQVITDSNTEILAPMTRRLMRMSDPSAQADLVTEMNRL